MTTGSLPGALPADGDLKQLFRLNYTEAALSSAIFTLGMAGSVFMIGFALALGATPVQIGLLTSLPFFASVVQVAGSYLMERYRTTKGLCIVTYNLFHVMWALTIAAPLVIFRGTLADYRLAGLMAGIFLISMAQALLNVSWMAWNAQVVPEGVRGRFFGNRNVIAGLCGMGVALAAGRFLDFWGAGYPDADAALPYAIIFGIAIVFGLLAVLALRRVPDAPTFEAPDEAFLVRLARPVQDQNFRNFIFFGMAWGFASGLAAPFFTVFMLQELSMTFSLIALLGLMSGVANMGGMMAWGRLTDAVGPKPLLLICSGMAGLLTAVWVVLTPENVWLLWPLLFLNGWFWSGIGLCSISLLMGLVGSQRGGSYFAIFAAAAGVSTAVAPIAGGYLVAGLSAWELSLYGFAPGPLPVLFLVAGLMRLATLPFLLRVEAPAKIPLQDLLRHVRNMKRFQTGIMPAWGGGIGALENLNIALATGAVVMEAAVERTAERTTRAGRAVGQALFRVDAGIERRVGVWEAFIARAIDRVIPFIRAVIQWLRNDDGPPRDREGGNR
ncbi:MAG: MFS transporter [Thermaerobacterales bacterium]